MISLGPSFDGWTLQNYYKTYQTRWKYRIVSLRKLNSFVLLLDLTIKGTCINFKAVGQSVLDIFEWRKVLKKKMWQKGISWVNETHHFFGGKVLLIPKKWLYELSATWSSMKNYFRWVKKLILLEKHIPRCHMCSQSTDSDTPHHKSQNKSKMKWIWFSNAPHPAYLPHLALQRLFHKRELRSHERARWTKI